MATFKRCDRCGFVQDERMDNTQSIRRTTVIRGGSGPADVHRDGSDLCRSCFVDVIEFAQTAIDGPTWPLIADSKIAPFGLDVPIERMVKRETSYE